MLTTSGTQKQLLYLYPSCWQQARRSKQGKACIIWPIGHAVQDSGSSERAK